MEDWIDVKDYEGLYRVSNTGKIKSLPRIVTSGNGAWRLLPERVLKPVLVRSYGKISLCRGNKKKLASVHRLVAEAFIPNPENKTQVNHINGVKWDNRLENLEWSTPSENQVHALKTGLKLIPVGEMASRSKLNWADVREIRSKLSDGATIKSLMELYGMCRITISNIKHNKEWIDGDENKRYKSPLEYSK